MGIELDQVSLHQAFQSRPDIQNAIAAASQGKGIFISLVRKETTQTNVGHITLKN